MAEEKDVKETLDLLEKNRIEQLIQAQRVYFKSGVTRSLAFRRGKLLTLREALKVYEPRILGALLEDLGKSPFEGYETELGMVHSEITFALAHLKGWMKTKRVETPLMHFPSESAVHKEALGVTLIISPWNYPLQLSLSPLVSAMAAGNCAVIKPSRYASHTEQLLAEMLAAYFPKEYITVISGGKDANEMLLLQKFDHIFFTGSPAVGKVVMEGAAKNLTPVTLELGGKSPCIVDASAKVDLAARRIVWGKCLNAGQTCVAPDYILVDEKQKEALIESLTKYIVAFYGSDPLVCDYLPHIINEKHFHRLCGLLEGENIRFGGGRNEETRKIEPTLVTNVSEDSPLMQEEIFGPILPILAYKHLEDAIEFVREREKPLALYLFTTRKSSEKRIIEELSFGGGCINDTIVHLANPHLGFGGVGKSGLGAYHGKRGFDTFTHEKCVLKKSNLIDVPLRYPPYEGKAGLLRFFLR